MGRERTAVIIGGGIVGVTSAYTLAREGWSVRIVERLDGPGRAASLGNGRQLSYSYTNALASPAMLGQIPRLLLGCDKAFRLNYRFDRSFSEWLLRFLGNATPWAYRRNTLRVLRLASQSREAMDKLLAQYPIEFERKQSGKLVLLRSGKDLTAAQKMAGLKRAAGLDIEVIDAEEAARIEPALRQSPDRLAGAVYSPDDETGNCQRFTEGLCRISEESFGVELLTGREVTKIIPQSCGANVVLGDGQSLQCDLLVIANGHHANDLLSPLGHRLPIEPMKGYSFTAPIGNAPPQVSITDSARRIVFTNLGDRMLVAGIAEIGRVDGSVDPSRLESMIASARSSLPEAAIYSHADGGWAGMRPMTPNSQPIIRMISRGIAVNAGQGMLGWTLAMGSAEVLADIVRRDG